MPLTHVPAGTPINVRKMSLKAASETPRAASGERIAFGTMAAQSNLCTTEWCANLKTTRIVVTSGDDRCGSVSSRLKQAVGDTP